MRRIPKGFLLSILVLTFFVTDAYAIDLSSLSIPSQIPDLQEQIDVNVSPETPNPNEDVTVSLDAYGTDIDTTNITWSVNGKVVKQGPGMKSIVINSGAAGTKTVVDVSLNTLGKVTSQEVIINPQNVDLIWEAHTYTPPFYKGKALFSPQENVVFVAIPDFTTGDNSSQVVYKRSEDLTVLGDKSGRGVNALSYKGSILETPVTIDVEASTDGGLDAKKEITLAPTLPQTLLYENNSLQGVLFNNEVSGGFDFGSAAEKSISAYPYYFGAYSRNDPNLAYTWAINGSQIAVPSTQNDMTFRNEKKEEGRSNIGVNVVNNSNFLEGADGGTSIFFSKPKSVFSF
jgi:hypothetical protein